MGVLPGGKVIKGLSLFAGVVKTGDKVANTGKKLLPNELSVGKYDDLISSGKKGDNLTPHHIPSAKHMEKHGVKKGDGISINMEHPHPGKGGRHRKTATYGNKSDVDMAPRDALASGIKDAKKIYKEDGLYNAQTREALQKAIKQNKENYPDVFKKVNQ